MAIDHQNTLDDGFTRFARGDCAERVPVGLKDMPPYETNPHTYSLQEVVFFQTNKPFLLFPDIFELVACQVPNPACRKCIQTQELCSSHHERHVNSVHK
jgi:hypothetical protein